MTNNNSASQAAPLVTDRSLFFTDLIYMPSGFKERKMWMAQSIYFAKRNSSPLVDPVLANKYRRLNLSLIDEQTYKEIVDPVIGDRADKVGGTADKFSADFKALPIDIHLDNIIEATISRIPEGLNCSVNDPVAKLREQEDKERMIAQVRVRELINMFLSQSGINVPPVSDAEDPYKWIEKFTNTDMNKIIDTIGSPVDQIRSQIKNDRGLRLFMKFLYKNGLEIAFEQAIRYYLIDLNKWEVRSDRFLKDLKNFNCYCGRWYTDLTTGMPVVKYMDPSIVHTSDFAEMDGEDMMYWHYEEPVTFAEFERMVGAELPDDERAKIFNYYKNNSSAGNNNDYHSILAKPNGRMEVANTKIKIGFFSICTQEANQFSEGYYNDQYRDDNSINPTWDDTAANKTVNEKKAVYNVWHSCYYLPMNQQGSYESVTSGSDTSWDWLASHIYRIEKNVDMCRYGVDGRYAKSELVVWRDTTRPSFTEIKERFMPKIHTTWHKMQNCIVNDLQAVVADYDLIGGLLGAVDEANKDSASSNGIKANQNAFINEIRSLKQSGQGWLKFRDKNGNKLEYDPSKLFVVIDNKMLEKAEKYLIIILTLYDLMTRALAFNDAKEGASPKARTPVAGIQVAMEGSDNNSYYIAKAFKYCYIMFAERVVQWVKIVCSEKKHFHYKERFKQLQDVVGFASGATLQGIEDIPMANVGLTVHFEDLTELKNTVNSVALNLLNQKEISPAILELVLSTRNWKLALFELEMERERVLEETAKERTLEFERAMALKDKDLQIAQALVGAKAQGVNSNIQTQGMIDGQLQQQMGQIKEQSALVQNDQRNNFKQNENLQKSDLDKDKESHKASLADQAAYV